MNMKSLHNFSTSKQLIINATNFINIKHYSFFISLFGKNGTFYGWGRKKSGIRAKILAKKNRASYTLLEDGFIRSIGLGVANSPAFSIVVDDIGIYYEATVPSRLEHILNNYDFTNNQDLLHVSRNAIALIKKNHISKYNSAPNISRNYFANDGKKRVLIIAQTAGDMSLKYGLAEQFTTDKLIASAKEENPDAHIYLKVHPDVLSGKKDSDIDIEKAKSTCKIISEDINPISLLKCVDKVYTKTSQMGFEALLVGCECVCFGMPFYAGWGLTDDRVTYKRRKRKLNVDEIFAAAYILYTRYANPYTKKPCDIIETIETIVKYRERDRKVKEKAFFFGFSRWKHAFVEPFFQELYKQNIQFINPFFKKSHLKLAKKKGFDKDSRVYIWGRKAYEEIQEYAKKEQLSLVRVEDGFIRSVGLGSDLTQPYSLVVDSRGIYFDPTAPSDLEHILQTYDFGAEPRLLERALLVKEYLVEKKLSKYNCYEHTPLEFPKDKPVFLVPGQVEDDASIRYGAPDMTNLGLLKEVRANNPEAYIVFKPHPDVLAGNRIGSIKNSDALLYCDRVESEVSIDSVLEYADEVHTMTSLVGFEALMRGKKVVTYGMPFYAGWGLTTDMKTCERRERKVSLKELIAATLILYPRYIDPETKNLCEIEVVLEAIDQERERMQASVSYKTRKRIRNFISRKSQVILRMFK